MNETTRPTLTSITPFFIVDDVAPSIVSYRDQLGFEVTYLAPDDQPFLARLQRDRVRILR